MVNISFGTIRRTGFVFTIRRVGGHAGSVWSHGLSYGGAE